jgi:hypothetical protein
MSFLSDCRETWNRRKDVMTFAIEIVMEGLINKKVRIFKNNLISLLSKNDFQSSPEPIQTGHCEIL